MNDISVEFTPTFRNYSVTSSSTLPQRIHNKHQSSSFALSLNRKAIILKRHRERFQTPQISQSQETHTEAQEESILTTHGASHTQITGRDISFSELKDQSFSSANAVAANTLNHISSVSLLKPDAQESKIFESSPFIPGKLSTPSLKDSENSQFISPIKPISTQQQNRSPDISSLLISQPESIPVAQTAAIAHVKGAEVKLPSHSLVDQVHRPTEAKVASEAKEAISEFKSEEKNVSPPAKFYELCQQIIPSIEGILEEYSNSSKLRLVTQVFSDLGGWCNTITVVAGDSDHQQNLVRDILLSYLKLSFSSESS